MYQTKIVLVDSSEIDLFIHETLLKKAGYNHIVSFTNPDVALAYLSDCNTPHYVATDINFPLASGFEFIDNVIKLNNDHFQHKLIVITASLNNADRQEVKKRNIRFVSKPLEIAVLPTLFS